VSTVSTLLRRTSLPRALDEFALTTVLLFIAVTVIRWLRDPGSPLFIADFGIAIAVIGAISGAVLTALILTPLGKRSGGHMNPAVTVILWLMKAFPRRDVLPYAFAQLLGSAAGAGLARLAWGPVVSLDSVQFGAIKPAPSWEPLSVFLAEAGAMAAIALVVGFFVVHSRYARLVPYAIGLSVGVVIALLGPLSGGCINPARQLGPAVLSGQTTDLWIYLVAPVLGAALGSWLHLFHVRWLHTRRHTVRPNRGHRAPRHALAASVYDADVLARPAEVCTVDAEPSLAGESPT
jgi:glycerol uptake facilitator protein/aquaporin Z